MPWRNDPDRYAVALLDALLAFEMASSTRDCALAAASWQVGIEGDPQRMSADGLHVVTNWEKFKTRAGARAATLEGRAATLREKQRRPCHDAGEANWRLQMGYAFMLVLGARAEAVDRVKAEVFQRARMVGEAVYCLRWMLPMVEARAPRKCFDRTS